MNKNLLLLALIWMGLSLKAQTTQIPDTNFETFLENNGMGNGIANDHLVSTAQINNVTSLNIANLNIADLTGIQDFTALESLYCHHNNLSQLDLSLNTQLKELYCNNNQLVSLTLYNNNIIEYLECQNNQLTQLDMKLNNSLRSLDCSNNQLNDLQLGTSSQFYYYLYCQNNQLNVLNLGSLPITELHCENNQLQSLDISQNTNISKLLCQNNRLQHLNIANGNNQYFTQFNATTNPDLTCVQVDDAVYMQNNWATAIDASAAYNTDCSNTVTDFDADELSFSISDNGVQIKSSKDIDCKLFDLSGKQIWRQKLKAGNRQICFDNLSSGLYIFSISQTNRYFLQKIIIP